MKKIKSILNVLLLSCTFLFFSCEKSNDSLDSRSHIHPDATKISFKDFLSQTKIKKFDLKITPSTSDNYLQGRSDDDIEFTAFVIDTVTVKQFVNEGVTTFTLPVIPNPYPNNENFYYNIVFYKVDSTYLWSILEYEKRFDDILVTEILNETTNNNLVNFGQRIYTTWTTGPIYHCTRTGPCADGPCDGCSLCVSIGTIMGSVEIPDYQFASIQQTPGSLNGGSGSGSGSAFSSSVIIAINNFKNTLSPSQLAIYNFYKADFDTYLKNNSHSFINALGSNPTAINPRAQQFVKDLINLAIANNATINLDSTNGPPNSLNFNNVQEFQNYLNSNQDAVGNDFQLLQQEEEMIASTKFQYPTYSIKAELKQQITPTYKLISVNSYITGVTFLLTWDQTNFVTSHSGNTATIDFYGKITYGVTIGTFNGLSVTVDVHYQIKVNKLTGNIISATQLP